MSRLDAKRRAGLPARAFAYIDSKGRRRLPIHDEPHVRNALARFNQVHFEDEAARERARRRLFTAAKRHGIVPLGFISGQLRYEQRQGKAGRLVIELGRLGAPGELEQRLRTVLGDPTLTVLHWSDAAGAYLDAAGKPVPLPAEGARRIVTYLKRHGRPMTALVHDPAVLDDPDLVETVLTAVRFVVENDRSRGQITATATAAASLPTGFVTLLMTDIEGSTVLLRRLGERYGDMLNSVRQILRASVSRTRGREIDSRADEFFAVFERAADAVRAAVIIQRALRERSVHNSVPVRVRIGIHSGRPTLTEVGYVGLAVHTVARLCAAAHGGQIIVSGTTRAAVRAAGPHWRGTSGRDAPASPHWRGTSGRDAPASPGGVRFRGLGRRRLRGLADPEALFEVQAEGLPSGFPPLRVRRPRRPSAARSRRRQRRVIAGE
jgi:class 3 adenylate cyclase